MEISSWTGIPSSATSSLAPASQVGKGSQPPNPAPQSCLGLWGWLCPHLPSPSHRPWVQAGANGGEVAVSAEPGRGAILQHGPLCHHSFPWCAWGCTVGVGLQTCPHGTALACSCVPASQCPHTQSTSIPMYHHSPALWGLPTCCNPLTPHPRYPASLHPRYSIIPAPLHPCFPTSLHPGILPPHIPAIPHAMRCQAISTKHPLLGNKLSSFVTLMKMELEQRGETHSLRSQVKCFNVKCAILLSLDRSHLMKAH